jgi:hypothetical protein
MTLRTRNRLIAFSIIAAPFVFFFCLLLFWNAEPLPPFPPLPNPNGYDDLVKAGEMVSNEFGNYDELSVTNLRVLLDKDAKALQIARTGLRGKCRVILSYDAASPVHLEELTAIKCLAHTFAAEGRLAEMESRPDNAAKSYLDMIYLANQSTYGGTLIDEMVGRAIEALGTEKLQELLGKLDSESCRKVAISLETSDSQRQTWDQVMQQERDWSRRTFRGIRYEIARLMMHKSLDKAIQSAEQKFKEQQIKTRQLIIEFAARAYELDKGHPPTNVSDLVPDYLKAIPQDPFTGTNMVYSPR